MISLGGGMPNPSTFPFTRITAELRDGSEIELTVKEPRSYDASEEQEDDLQPLAHDNELEDVLRDGWLKYFHRSLSELLLGSKLNVLMLLTPFALLAENFGWGDGLTFTLNLLAIAPFAERLGFVTEQLALHTNDTLVCLCSN